MPLNIASFTWPCFSPVAQQIGCCLAWWVYVAHQHSLLNLIALATALLYIQEYQHIVHATHWLGWGPLKDIFKLDKFNDCGKSPIPRLTAQSHNGSSKNNCTEVYLQITGWLLLLTPSLTNLCFQLEIFM